MSDRGLYQYSDRQLIRELESRELTSYRVKLSKLIYNLYWDFVDGKVNDQKLKDFFAATIDQRFV